MVYCSLVLLHGAGGAALKCKTQPHIGTDIKCTLYDLPVGGLMLVGDGEQVHGVNVDERHAAWQLPPLIGGNIWAAYLDGADKVLATGSADGVWRDYMTEDIYMYLADRAALMAKSDAETANGSTADMDTAQNAPQARQSPETTVVEASIDDDNTLAANGNAEENALADISSTSEAPIVDEVLPAESVGDAHAAMDVPHGDAGTPQAALVAADVAALIEYMRDYPPFAPLNDAIEGSRWVLVQDGDSAYLLGLLYDSTPCPTHLCYGVAGARNRPFRPDAEWLPATGSAEGEEGYWIVYNNID